MEIYDRNELLLNLKQLRVRLPKEIAFKPNTYLHFYYGNRYSIYNWTQFKPIHLRDDTKDSIGGKMINIFKNIKGLTILGKVKVILYYEKLPPFMLDKTILAIPTYHLVSKIINNGSVGLRDDDARNNIEYR